MTYNRNISDKDAPTNTRVASTRNYIITQGQSDAVFGIRQAKANTNTLDSDGAFETKGVNDWVGFIDLAGRSKATGDPSATTLEKSADDDGITVWFMVPTAYSNALKDIDPNRPKTCFYDVWPSDDGSTKTGSAKQRGAIYVGYSVNVST